MMQMKRRIMNYYCIIFYYLIVMLEQLYTVALLRVLFLLYHFSVMK